MKIVIGYDEIHAFVEAKTGREVVLTAVDERTVKVDAKVRVKVPFLGEIDKNIDINVAVERIEGEDVYLRYDGGMGTDMMISGLLTFMSSTPALRMVEKNHGNGLIVHLSEISEARKVLDTVELTNIVFQDNSVVAEGRLK